MSPKRNDKISIFLDANIIVRFLTRDDEQKAEDVKQLFLLLEAGKISAETDAIVVAEIIWVLSSFYKLDRSTISEYISLFLATNHLIIKEKPLVQKAVELYKNINADYIDCFVAVVASKRKIAVCSYDRDFNKFEGIERIEPKDIVKKFQ